MSAFGSGQSRPAGRFVVRPGHQTIHDRARELLLFLRRNTATATGPNVARHHTAANQHVRTRLALTENNPNLKPYDEKAWAELSDARSLPVEVSLSMLEAMHARWVSLLRTLAPADFSRTMMHPQNGLMVIDPMLELYAWHGRHHTAHITALRERNGW